MASKNRDKMRFSELSRTGGIINVYTAIKYTLENMAIIKNKTIPRNNKANTISKSPKDEIKRKLCVYSCSNVNIKGIAIKENGLLNSHWEY